MNKHFKKILNNNSFRSRYISSNFILGQIRKIDIYRGRKKYFQRPVGFILEFKGLNGRFTTRQALHSKVENIFAGGSRLVGHSWLAQRIRNRRFQVSCPSAGIRWFNNTSLYLPFFLCLSLPRLWSLCSSGMPYWSNEHKQSEELGVGLPYILHTHTYVFWFRYPNYVAAHSCRGI